MARKFSKAQLSAARAEIARRDIEFQAKCEAHRLDPSLPQPVLDMDYTPAMMEAWNIDSCAELDAWAAKDAARQAAEDAAKPKPPPEPYRPPPTKSVDQRTKDRYEKLVTPDMDRRRIALPTSGEARALTPPTGAPPTDAAPPIGRSARCRIGDRPLPAPRARQDHLAQGILRA